MQRCSADLDDICAGCRCGLGAFDQPLGDIEERRRLRALWSCETDRKPAISTFANRRDKLDRSKKGNIELLGRALRSALRKDVDLLMAVRAGEVAHVLDDAEDFDIHLMKHLQRLPRVLEAYVAWC